MKALLKLFPALISVVFLLSCQQEKDRKVVQQEEFTFAFLTDIHVQPERKAMEGFRQAIDTINRLNPDFVITGGDLIMDAMNQKQSRADSLYAIYIELSHLLNMPVYNTMGNHEVFGIHERSGVSPSHPLFGEKMFEARLGQSYYGFDYGGWRFYILNSVEGTADREYKGRVDSVQLRWLAADLRNVPPETPICISLHIPLISVQTQLLEGATAPNKDWLVVANSKEVLDVFRNHNLKLVLQGHLHFLEDIYAMGTRFITGGAVCASWWRGPRNGMEEGFLLIKVKGKEYTWKYVDFGWEVTP